MRRIGDHLKKNTQIYVFLGIMALFTLITPNFTTMYTQSVVNTVLAYFIAALGMNIMLGMGGQISFATCAFMGLGGYISADLMKMGLPSPLTILCGLIVCGLFAFLFGLLMYRLAGYFATFATLALAVTSYGIYNSFKPLTGGADGLINIPTLSFGPLTLTSMYSYFYLLALACVLAAVFVERLRKTSYGRSLAAVRDNEIAARTLGVNVYMTKILSFVMAGVLAGLAGIILAHQNRYLSAGTLTLDISNMFIIIAMLGGIRSTFGTLIGALIVVLLPEVLRPIKEYIRMVYGFVIIILMVFMPMGLWGLLEMIGKSIRSRIWVRPEGRESRRGANS
ncbi:MAG: branched-chain amino acid ABC transporter permease [Peptococcaceae bacterium]|nr:branched-chain amino acid ABC transporter permease [Peptococcaceae bacterium]